MLLQTLPSKICGIPIQTGFMKWLKVGKVLDAIFLTPQEKGAIILYNVFGEVPEDEEKIAALYEGAQDFYMCGKKNIEGITPPKEKLRDWEKDSDAIWGDFFVYARMDLDDPKVQQTLHWWKFRAILQSLPNEAAINQRMSTRDIDLSKVKDPERQRELAERKRVVALGAVEYDEL